jgi:hypothetical protein
MPIYCQNDKAVPRWASRESSPRRVGPPRRLVSAKMNKPHVEALDYEFHVRTAGHYFARAKPWEGELGSFQCRLAEGQLGAKPLEHFSSSVDARAVLEPYLRSWEAHAELLRGVWVEFAFEAAEIIDLEPDRVGREVAMEGVVRATASISADIAVEHQDHPAPPIAMAATPLVEVLRSRLRDIRYGREKLLAGAYYCLTRIEREFGGDKAASAALNVSRETLRELGRLTALNDPTQARKAVGAEQELTIEQDTWIRNVLARLIVRIGEAGACDAASLPQLTVVSFLPESMRDATVASSQPAPRSTAPLRREPPATPIPDA